MSFKCDILLAIACMQTCVLFSQTTTQTTEYLNDPAAKRILDGVSRTMRKDTTKTSTFTLVKKNTNGKTDTTNGEMILKKHKYKIVLHTAKGREEYYNDGKLTAVYIQKDNSVACDTAPDPAMQKKKNRLMPYDIFTVYETGFNYHFIKEDTLNGKIMQHINLYPLYPGNVNFHSIHLIIDKKEKRIVVCIFTNKDSSEVTYSFNSYTANLPVPESIFRFNRCKICLRESDEITPRK